MDCQIEALKQKGVISKNTDTPWRLLAAASRTCRPRNAHNIQPVFRSAPRIPTRKQKRKCLSYPQLKPSNNIAEQHAQRLRRHAKHVPEPGPSLRECLRHAVASRPARRAYRQRRLLASTEVPEHGVQISGSPGISKVHDSSLISRPVNRLRNDMPLSTPPSRLLSIRDIGLWM